MRRLQKVMNFDRLGKRVRPGTFGEIKVGQREYPEYPKSPSVKQKRKCRGPTSADPIRPFPRAARWRICSATYFALSYKLHYIILYHFVLFHSILYYIIWYYIIWYHSMLCYIIARSSLVRTLCCAQSSAPATKGRLCAKMAFRACNNNNNNNNTNNNEIIIILI